MAAEFDEGGWPPKNLLVAVLAGIDPKMKVLTDPEDPTEIVRVDVELVAIAALLRGPLPPMLEAGRPIPVRPGWRRNGD